MVINIKDNLARGIVIISFFSDPFILLNAFTDKYRIINVILFFIALLYISNEKHYLTKRDKIWFGSWLITFLYMSLHSLLLNDFKELIQSFGYLFKIIFLFVVIISIKNNYRFLLNCFFRYNIYIMYASILLFFLLAVGVHVPVIKIFPQFQNEIADNYLYPLGITNTQFEIGFATIIRISGIADEPGQLALIITYLLVINQFTLKSKFYQNSLIFCGLFTFSLGLYVSLIFFLLYLLLVNYKKMTHLIRNTIVISVTVITLLGAVFYSIPEYYRPIIEEFTINRLKKDYPNKLVAGDNRSEAIKYNYGLIKNDNKLLLGYGVTKGDELGVTREFAYYGFLYFLFMYVPFYRLLKEYKNSLMILLLLTIGINFIQRPGLFQLFYMIGLTFIYYSPLLIVNDNKIIDNGTKPN